MDETYFHKVRSMNLRYELRGGNDNDNDKSNIHVNIHVLVLLVS